MDQGQLNRLQEQQELAIAETDAKIDQLQKFQSDYKALKDRLDTLADEVSYDVMVPFGRLAFMPGQLVHTNEVLVLLGDNWFVERSAKQAAGIISRRMEGLSTQLSEMESQKKLLTPHKQFTEEMQRANQEAVGVREICEEYDEEAEKQWRVNHQESVRKARQDEKEAQSAKDTGQDRQRPLSDDELWARLEELERQEEEGGEMFRDEDDDAGSEEESSPEESSDEEEEEEEEDGDRRVQWKDLNTDALRTPSTIYFSHSRPLERPANLTGDARQGIYDTESERGGGGGDAATSYSSSNHQQIITSPSDIYKQFYKPKSILKSPTSEEFRRTSGPESEEKKMANKDQSSAWPCQSMTTRLSVEKLWSIKQSIPVQT